MKFVYTLSTAATNAAINETKFTIFAKNWFTLISAVYQSSTTNLLYNNYAVSLYDNMLLYYVLRSSESGIFDNVIIVSNS